MRKDKDNYEENTSRKHMNIADEIKKEDNLETPQSTTHDMNSKQKYTSLTFKRLIFVVVVLRGGPGWIGLVLAIVSVSSSELLFFSFWG